MENQNTPALPERPGSVEPRTNWQQNLLFFADLFERITGSLKRNCLDLLLPPLLLALLHHYGQSELLAIVNLLRLIPGWVKIKNK